MSLEEGGLHLAPDLHWRVFSDGITVYVAETCETHLLPAAYGQFMPAVLGSAKAGRVSTVAQATDASAAIPTALSDEAIQQLVALGIFRRVQH